MKKEDKNNGKKQTLLALFVSSFLPIETIRASKQNETSVELNIAMVANKNFYCAIASSVTVAHLASVKSRLVAP